MSEDINKGNSNEDKRKNGFTPRKPQIPRSPSGFMWVYIILVVGLISFFCANDDGRNSAGKLYRIYSIG